jgi:hypothetical protein
MSLEDYFDDIRGKIHLVDKAIDETQKEISRFVDFVSSPDLFEYPNQFKRRLFDLQSRFDSLIRYMIDIEQMIYSLREQYSLLPTKTVKLEENSDKKSLLRRLFPVQRKPTVKPPEKVNLTPSLEYAYRILDKLGEIYYEYERHRALISFQDSPEDKGRLEFEIRHFSTELIKLAGDANNYIISSLQRRRDLAEQILNDLMAKIIAIESGMPLSK